MITERSGPQTALVTAVLASLVARLASHGPGVTGDMIVADVIAWAGAPVVTTAAPQPVTNFSVAAVGGSATAMWTPPGNATELLVSRDGVPVSGPLGGTATSWMDPAVLTAGTYTYSIIAINDTGQSSSVSAPVTVAAPPAPAAPVGLVGVPNGGHPLLNWGVAAAGTVTGYQITLAGTQIDSINNPLLTSWADPSSRVAGSYTYGVVPVNAGRVGTAATVPIVVPSVASDITLTTRGTTSAAAGVNATATLASGSFTPTAGRVLVAMVAMYMPDAGIACSISDNFGDTGGTGWVAAGTPSASAVGDYYLTAILTRTVGTSPAAGTVTMTRTPATSMFWFADLTVVELANATSSTALHVGSTSQPPTTPAATITADLTAAPDAKSIVLALAASRHAAGTLTLPAGYTSLNNDVPSGGSGTFAACYKIDSTAETQAFSGCGTEINGVISVEIGQAVGAAGFGKQAAPVGLAANVTLQSGNKGLLGLTWAQNASAAGFDVWVGAQGFSPVDNSPTYTVSPVASNFNATTLLSPGTYDVYVAFFDSNGLGAKAKVTTTVASQSSASLQPKFGGTVQAMTVGSGNDQFVTADFFNLVPSPNGKFYTIWPTNDGTGHPSPTTHNAMVAAAIAYGAVGQSLHGLVPCFTMHPGCGDNTMAAVLTGAFDAAIDSFAQQLLAYYQATGIIPRCRIGHEYTLGFAWGVTNDSASLTTFRNGMDRHVSRIHAVFSGVGVDKVLIEQCSYTVDYDYSLALSSNVDLWGADLYDDWQGAGSAKSGVIPSTGVAFATYQDPVAAWNGRWYRNSSPSAPSPGSDAWLWNLAKANGKPYAISECGLIARVDFATAGGGDNPTFVTNICDLIATSLSDHPIDHLNYFNDDVNSSGSGAPNQFHNIVNGDFPVSLAVLRTRMAA